MRCLVEAIKMIDQEKQATPKREQFIGIQRGILTFGALKQALIKRRSKPTTTQGSALDLKWFSIHMGEEWTLSIMIGLHQTIKLDFTLLLRRLIGSK